MPDPDEVLALQSMIAERGIAIAIAWHIAMAGVLVAVWRGWRPSRELARALLSLPLASVSAAAFAFGNPFNGIVLAIGAGLLLALARHDEVPVSRPSSWQWWSGAALLAYGWVYPHFLTGSPLAYLYAAPVGLAPCPTLSVVLGFALLGGLGRRAWGTVLSVLGLFYGVFGIARLGVVLDVGLVAGASLVAVTTWRGRSIARRATS
jgi:hypothetical protein